MIIPVKMQSLEVHINATRSLVFQYLTAFGVPGPDGTRSTTVLQDDGDRKLVEFRTEVKGLFGRTRRVRTVEWVTLHPPDAIGFDGLKGPLPLLQDRFELEEHGESCTVLRYHSTIGANGWWLGWPVAKWYVKPLVERHMREHMAEMKGALETRAESSKAYPHEACTHEAPPGPVQVGVAHA